MKSEHTMEDVIDTNTEVTDDVFETPHSVTFDTPDGAITNSRMRAVSRSLSTTSSIIEDDLEDPNLPEVLHAAISLDCVALQAEITQSGASCTNTATKSGRTAAHLILIKYGGLYFTNQIESRPALIAMLKLLTDAGLDLNRVDKLKQTALHLASSIAKQPDVIRALLAGGARIDNANRTHQTALHIAASTADLANVQVLVQEGSDVNAADSNGQTALHIVSKGRRQLLLVQFLLRRGADIDARDCAQRTPLHVAAKAARTEVVEELVNVGADVNATQSAGQTPLHLAASNDMAGDTLQVLLDSDADVDARDAVTMETPLHRAVSRGLLENILALAKHARADVRNAFGETVLHTAATCHKMAAWQCLLRMTDADVNARDDSGHTPLSKAIKAKNVIAMAMIRRHLDISTDT